MAGGIFPGRPFEPNLKCIVFTVLVAGGYWWLPRRNAWVLLLLLWLPYVSMAWYDWAYHCTTKLNVTVLPFERYLFVPFKDPETRHKYATLSPSDRQFLDVIDHVATYTILLLITAWVVVAHKRQ
jgi:hypothetical protein